MNVIADYYKARERFEENYGRNVQDSILAYQQAREVIVDNEQRTGKMVVIILIAIYALIIFFSGFIILFS